MAGDCSEQAACVRLQGNGTGMFRLFQRADSPPWGLSGSDLLAVQTHSFQSHDSVALFRAGEDLIILEITSLAHPTWRKLNYLNLEQLASHPGGRSEAGTPELPPCWAGESAMAR